MCFLKVYVGIMILIFLKFVYFILNVIICFEIYSDVVDDVEIVEVYLLGGDFFFKS